MLDHIKSLPPLPASVMRIQELCMSTEVDIRELTKVIEGDPMLSANILKAVNSPLYGMSKEIASIQQAVMLFGISMIRGFAAANAIKKSIPLDLSPYGAGPENLSDVSTLQSALVREWYSKVDRSAVSQLGSGAFLMELGKLVASQHLISVKADKVFLKELEHGEPIETAEKRLMEMSSYEIAAMMFEHWNFEPSLVDMIRNIGKEGGNVFSQALTVVKTAVNLREPLSDESIEKAVLTARSYGFEEDLFKEAADKIRG